ncbi:MAG: aspartate/glutamate racemase family protein, partial [Verrucomicrobiota bacterium]
MAEPFTVGILDSGVGGLSVLKEIHALQPNLELLYVGDSAWCPYGTKTPEQIIERVEFISEYLIDRGADAIVIACNSATIHAVESLRSVYPLPIIGMEPAVKPACQKTKSGVIGVLATEASIAGEKFHRLVDRTASGVNVITRPCPRFVELVEQGMRLEGEDAELSGAIDGQADAQAEAAEVARQSGEALSEQETKLD